MRCNHTTRRQSCAAARLPQNLGLREARVHFQPGVSWVSSGMTSIGVLERVFMAATLKIVGFVIRKKGITKTVIEDAQSHTSLSLSDTPQERRIVYVCGKKRFYKKIFSS